MEDPDIVVDLRYHNGRDKSEFDVFWQHCERFLNEDISVAVDDRHHGQITHHLPELYLLGISLTK